MRKCFWVGKLRRGRRRLVEFHGILREVFAARCHDVHSKRREGESGKNFSILFALVGSVEKAAAASSLRSHRRPRRASIPGGIYSTQSRGERRG